MATVTQITLIIACACLVDCRFPKHQSNSHQDHRATVRTNLRDTDAVVFPFEHDSHIIKDDKKANDVIKIQNPHGNIELKDDKKKIDVANVVVSLISKIIPEVEVKDVFTNPVPEKIIKDKIIDVIKKPEKVVDNFDVGIKHDIARNENENTTENVVPVNNINDTLASLNDLSSRFGGNNNYMLVPVAANVQNYQPQSYPNIIPISNVQGNVPTQTYVTPNELHTQNQQFILSNVGPSVQFTTPNGITNAGNTLQVPANVVTNIDQVQFPANSVNFAQGSNTYVPVNVPNTYVINGQLYAAVTVPNNGNIPSTLYYVNPQVGYQVQVVNNLPLYKLVSVNGENQVQNK